MYTKELAEARIEDASNILVAPSTLHENDSIRDFFGTTITPDDLATGSPDLAQKTVYLCGDSVVVFSVDSNRHLKHKIVLAAPAPTAENQWLGVTFRTSKTFLRFHDGLAYLPQGARLTPADDE